MFTKFTEFIQAGDGYLKYLDQVDPRLIERYKDFRRRERISPNGHPNTRSRNGVTPRTLNNELMFLRTIFNLAKRRRFVKRRRCNSSATPTALSVGRPTDTWKTNRASEDGTCPTRENTPVHRKHAAKQPSVPPEDAERLKRKHYISREQPT